MKLFSKQKPVSMGQSLFQMSPYQQHNIARLAHLDSLGLSLSGKTVFEFGAGIGDHTYYLMIKKCKVLPTDSRDELLEFIQKRFAIPTMKFDVEHDLNKLADLPYYDIFYCYGLLYHVSNPEQFLLSMKNKCGMLLLETCVSHDFRESGPHLVNENLENPTQATSGTGCRPSRSWIFEKLKSVFPFVYLPTTQPNHQEFPKDWTKPMEDRSTLVRAVFIASMNPIENPLLTDQLIKTHS